MKPYSTRVILPPLKACANRVILPPLKACANRVILSGAQRSRRICGSLLIGLYFFVGINSPRILAAQSSTDAAILRRVDDHYNHLSSLRATYTEHYSGMGLDRTETGTLLLKKPGRMRWSYTAPVGKVFILDGKYGWFYTPGDNQATRISAKKLDDLRSPLRLLLGHTQLQKELDNLTVARLGSGYIISGVPKGMAQRVKRIALTVTASGAIDTMRLEETDGSVTEFTFAAMQENLPTPDADFTFTPPPGVEIVDGLAPI